jgi:hypothetical protein
MLQNEPARGGIVKYLNEGLQAIRTSRREVALEKAKQACGGPFKITAEGDNPEGQMLMRSDYHYIHFSCLDETPTAQN